jgi:hypothetical protein
MKPERRQWLLWNALFAGALYVGVWLQVSLVGYAIAVFIWITCALYLSVLYAGAAHARPRPVPRWWGYPFDAGVLALLVFQDWPATATGYALSVIAEELVYGRFRPPPA